MKDLEYEDELAGAISNVMSDRLTTYDIEAGFTTMHRLARFAGQRVIVCDGHIAMVPIHEAIVWSHEVKA